MTPNQQATAHRGAVLPTQRERDSAAIVALYQSLMSGRPTEGPAFLDVPITMAQAKVLFLVEAVGELHMSDLVARLGVSPSTLSGLVDRLVEHGLVSRRDDPADRRQVVVAMTAQGTSLADQFRQLGVGELQGILAELSDGELEVVRRAFEALDRAVRRVGPHR